MIKKKLNKLIGLKFEDFLSHLESGQIHARPARLIPTVKIGDEMALTSIFLSTIRLVKEYRDTIFKDLRLTKAGRIYYYTEVSFPEIESIRIDGMIFTVIGGTIKDASFFEMKNKNNKTDESQVEKMIYLAKRLGIPVVTTVSNEFVADPSQSPVNPKVPKGIRLNHFSWTYLKTIGQLLLFKNDQNIRDEDQVEIMREVLSYLDSPISGVTGYTQMKPGWKELAENIRAQKPLRISDLYIEDAVLGWYEEEKDMALLLSRKLGVLVKSSFKDKSSVKTDIKRLVKDHFITGSLSIKNSVSDIKMVAEFERRTVSMSVRISPPLDKKTIARITWIGRQLENCSKRSEIVFNKLRSEIWIEANIKYARENLKVKVSELESLKELSYNKEIQAFHVVAIRSFSSNFASSKKFIELIETMVLEFYEGIVQHMTNWNKPAPKITSQ